VELEDGEQFRYVGFCVELEEGEKFRFVGSSVWNWRTVNSSVRRVLCGTGGW